MRVTASLTCFKLRIRLDRRPVSSTDEKAIAPASSVTAEIARDGRFGDRYGQGTPYNEIPRDQRQQDRAIGVELHREAQHQQRQRSGDQRDGPALAAARQQQGGQSEHCAANQP